MLLAVLIVPSERLWPLFVLLKMEVLLFLIGTTTGRFIVGYTLTILLAGISLGRSLNKKGRDGNDNPSILPPQSMVVLLVSIFMLCFAAMLSISYAGRQSWHTDEIWLVVLLLPLSFFSLFYS